MKNTLEPLIEEFGLSESGKNIYRKFQRAMKVFEDVYDTEIFYNLTRNENFVNGVSCFDAGSSKALDSENNKNDEFIGQLCEIDPSIGELLCSNAECNKTSVLEEVTAFAIEVASLCDELTGNALNWGNSYHMTNQELVTRLTSAGSAIGQYQIADQYALSSQLRAIDSENAAALHTVRDDVDVYARQLESCPSLQKFWFGGIFRESAFQNSLEQIYEQVLNESMVLFPDSLTHHAEAQKLARSLMEGSNSTQLIGNDAIQFVVVYRVFLHFLQEDTFCVFDGKEVHNAMCGNTLPDTSSFANVWDACYGVFRLIVHENLPTRMQRLMSTNPEASAEELILLSVETINTLFMELNGKSLVQLMIYMMCDASGVTLLGPAIDALDEKEDHIAIVTKSLRSIQFGIDDSGCRNDTWVFLYGMEAAQRLLILPEVARIMFIPLEQ